jgi:hypothetical protein
MTGRYPQPLRARRRSRARRGKAVACAYLTALAGAVTYRILGRDLTLLRPDGSAAARLVAAALPEGEEERPALPVGLRQSAEEARRQPFAPAVPRAGPAGGPGRAKSGRGMSESGRTEWEQQIDRSLADLLAEVAALRRRLDDLESVVARLAQLAGEEQEEQEEQEANAT